MLSSSSCTQFKLKKKKKSIAYKYIVNSFYKKIGKKKQRCPFQQFHMLSQYVSSAFPYFSTPTFTSDQLLETDFSFFIKKTKKKNNQTNQRTGSLDWQSDNLGQKGVLDLLCQEDLDLDEWTTGPYFLSACEEEHVESNSRLTTFPLNGL